MTDDPIRFDQMNLPDDFMDVINELGFTHPTPIQAEALPHAFAGRDVIGKAETGTGKTLAFGLPMLDRIDPERLSTQGLVVCPTRELAFQVLENLEPFCKQRGIEVGLAIGGQDVSKQLQTLRGSQVIVGTPGRVMEINRDHKFSFGWCETVVLDEFDRMLDMGFIDDVTTILEMTPAEGRQTLLFSATYPPAIKRVAQKFMDSPVTVETASGVKTADTITQSVRMVTRQSKFRILRETLEDMDPEATCIVFANSKKDVRFLDRELWGRGFSMGSLSSDHDQDVRFSVLEAFKTREFRIIVATDVASRGLDIPHVGHVINYTPPMDVEDYVHRIGRTGRAGREGRVTNLVAPDELKTFGKIIQFVGEDKIKGADRILEAIAEGLGDVPRGGSRDRGRGHGRRDRSDGDKGRRSSKGSRGRRRDKKGGGGSGNRSSNDS